MSKLASLNTVESQWSPYDYCVLCGQIKRWLNCLFRCCCVCNRSPCLPQLTLTNIQYWLCRLSLSVLMYVLCLWIVQSTRCRAW